MRTRGGIEDVFGGVEHRMSWRKQGELDVNEGGQGVEHIKRVPNALEIGDI
jgi:hypothetical protein